LSSLRMTHRRPKHYLGNLFWRFFSILLDVPIQAPAHDVRCSCLNLIGRTEASTCRTAADIPPTPLSDRLLPQCTAHPV
jgi:hypothetical protein